MKPSGFRIVFYLGFAVALFVVPGFCRPDDTQSISFEEFTNGWRISDDYSSQGVRFVSDYVNPSTRFRSAPTITIAKSPHSAPNVLENASSDTEIFNSGGVPLVILFSKPVKSVSFRFGCVDCEVVPTATIKLYDCAGVERLSLTANSAMNFPTLIQAIDPTETTRTVVPANQPVHDFLGHRPAGAGYGARDSEHGSRERPGHVPALHRVLHPCGDSNIGFDDRELPPGRSLCPLCHRDFPGNQGVRPRKGGDHGRKHATAGGCDPETARPPRVGFPGGGESCDRLPGPDRPGGSVAGRTGSIRRLGEMGYANADSTKHAR